MSSFPDTKRISVDHVTQEFPGRLGAKVRAVDDVSFTLSSQPAGIISLVGASGSGKSTVARIMLGLQRPTKGAVHYGGKDIAHLSRREHDGFRRDVQAVFQDPYSIFNPFYRVDRMLHQAIRRFRLTGSSPDDLIEESLHAVDLVPGEVLGRYAHQLSGGQRQRLMLARVHMLQPAFVIADEPVSMLDAQVRKHFLDIMIDFQQKYGMTTLFITHDLSTVAYVGGDMMTMYQGQIVEAGPVRQLLTKPTHAYTKLLLASVPPPDPDQRWLDRIDTSGGEVKLADSDG